MDILDKIKLFISDSLQSLFAKQKEDFTHTIHKESVSTISELKNYISQQLQNNERDMANLQQNVFNLSKNFQTIDEKLNAILKAIEQESGLHSESQTVSVVEEDMSMPITTTFYARMVDSLDPLGFKTENLKATKEGCAFKITINNDCKGTYTFIDDEDIQQELLAAFNPLITDSSSYDVLPQNPTIITIEQEGTLIKEGNILQIIDKQKIRIS